ncbi:MAG: hypothetical protein ACLR1T_16450 [Evtepia gabavorous]
MADIISGLWRSPKTDGGCCARNTPGRRPVMADLDWVPIHW